MPETITPEELDGVAQQCQSEWRGVREVIERAAATIRELRQRAVPEGWEPAGQSEMRNESLNLAVYLAGSEGWRIKCLCRTASRHLDAVREGHCRVGLASGLYEDWRAAIRSAEEMEDNRGD